MTKSVINPKFEFDSKTWVISVINTGGVLNGHSVLLVEGMKRTQGSSMFPEEKLFVGQYDIFAATVDHPGVPDMEEQKGLSDYLSSINQDEGSLGKLKPLLKNQKGVIVKIRTFPEKLTDDSKGYTRDYSAHLHKTRTYYAKADKAQIMLESIYRQAAEIKEIVARQDFAALPKYQLYGNHHPFTDSADDGINCANFCYENMALAEAGPRWHELSSKPPKPCTIL